MKVDELKAAQRCVTHAQLAQALGVATSTLRRYIAPHRAALKKQTAYTPGRHCITHQQLLLILKLLGYD